MEYGAIDLHRRSSVICLAIAGGSYEEQTVTTTRSALTAYFAGRGQCRILIESSTESEWVARLLARIILAGTGAKGLLVV